LQEENSRNEQGTWKDRAPDRSTADPGHYRYATLITRMSITVQASRSEHEGPGKTETP